MVVVVVVLGSDMETLLRANNINGSLPGDRRAHQTPNWGSLLSPTMDNGYSYYAARAPSRKKRGRKKKGISRPNSGSIFSWEQYELRSTLEMSAIFFEVLW